jgi:hypothetical protein
MSRQIDLWNTVFSCDNMLNQLDSTINLLSPEMTGQANRWSGTYTEWYNNAMAMRDFISQRCNYLSTGFINCYNLNGPHEITIDTDPAGAGTVQLNSLNLTQFPWTGNYFGGIATKLKVTPNSNYAFVNWSANTQTFTPNATALDVETNLTSGDTIIAHFISTTALPEVPGTDPSVHVFPTVFSNTATINYNLPEKAAVSMKLYTLLGAEVAKIGTDGNILKPGHYGVELDLSGSSLPAGMYMLHFKAGSYEKSIKLIYQPQ